MVFSRTRLDEMVVYPVVCQLGCHAMDLFDVFVVVEAYKKTAAGLVSVSPREAWWNSRARPMSGFTNPKGGTLW